MSTREAKPLTISTSVQPSSKSIKGSNFTEGQEVCRDSYKVSHENIYKGCMTAHYTDRISLGPLVQVTIIIVVNYMFPSPFNSFSL